MGYLSPTMSWILERLDGVENWLKVLAPNMHLIGRDVVTEAGPPGGGRGAGGGPAGGQGTVQRAPNHGSAGRAWKDLPAIQRAVGAPPLVAPNRPFAASLAADNPPPPILAPLSHGRGLEAPSGIAVGVAKPVTVARDSPIPRSVQRSPVSRHAHDDALGAPDEPDPEPEPSSAPAPVPRLAVAGDGPSAPARTLVRSRDAVMAPPPPGMILPPRTAGSRGLPGDPQVQRALATPAKAPPSPSSREIAPLGQASSLGSHPPLSGTTRLNLGQARRLGLGAPIGAVPAGSMGAGAGPAGAAPPAMPLVQRAPLPAASAPEPDSAVASLLADGRDEATRPGPGAAGADFSQRVPETPAPSRIDRPTIPTTGPGASVDPHVLAALGGATSPAPAARGRAARRDSVPLASARPLRVSVQRSPLTVPLPGAGAASEGASGASATTSANTLDGPVKIHRDHAAGDLSRSLDARSFTHGGEVFLPASHGPLTSGTGRSLLAHELTHVTQQRRMGSSLPDEASPQGRTLEAEAVAAERSGQMPLAPGHVGHGHDDPVAPGTGSSSPSPRSTASGPQRAGIPGLAPQPDVAPTGTTTIDFSAVQRAPKDAEAPKGAAGASAPPGRIYSEPELEDLASQLYGRIGRRLRRELLVDRERAGLAMDIR